MIGEKYNSGDQIRELCDSFNGRRFLHRYGYVVDRIDETTVSILWTHDGLGLPLIGSSRMNVRDIQGTGQKYHKTK